MSEIQNVINQFIYQWNHISSIQQHIFIRTVLIMFFTVFVILFIMFYGLLSFHDSKVLRKFITSSICSFFLSVQLFWFLVFLNAPGYILFSPALMLLAILTMKRLIKKQFTKNYVLYALILVWIMIFYKNGILLSLGIIVGIVFLIKVIIYTVKREPDVTEMWKHEVIQNPEFQFIRANEIKKESIYDRENKHFWNHHNYSKDEYINLANESIKLYEDYRNGRSIDELLKTYKFAGAYFSDNQTIHVCQTQVEDETYFELMTDGRHRVVAAQELDIHIPVKIFEKKVKVNL